MDPAEKIKELEAKLAEMATRLQESEAIRMTQASAMEDMQKKMDAAEINGAAPEIEAVAADQGVAKAADAAATLSAVVDALKMTVKGRDALPTIRALAERAKARDAKPGRPTFTTPPEPVKTGDATSTDAGAESAHGKVM